MATANSASSQNLTHPLTHPRATSSALQTLSKCICGACQHAQEHFQNAYVVHASGLQDTRQPTRQPTNQQNSPSSPGARVQALAFGAMQPWHTGCFLVVCWFVSLLFVWSVGLLLALLICLLVGCWLCVCLSLGWLIAWVVGLLTGWLVSLQVCLLAG